MEKWEPGIRAERELALASDELPRLLLLPGLACNESLWVAQCEGLADICHTRVARLDEGHDMQSLASSVLQQAPDGAFLLAGLSMGGYVALEIMRQAPQRVLGLALIDTSARADTNEASQKRRAAMRQSESEFAAVIEQMLPNLLHPKHYRKTELTDCVRDMAQQVGAQTFRQQQEAIIGRSDSRPDLAKITCPTLVVCGREDAITPPELHSEMVAQIAGAQLVLLDTCGHLSPLEQPEQLTQHIRSWITHTCRTYTPH
jgi:pimeloyl-ACP methyl ester carboxylesterase